MINAAQGLEKYQLICNRLVHLDDKNIYLLQKWAHKELFPYLAHFIYFFLFVVPVY